MLMMLAFGAEWPWGRLLLMMLAFGAERPWVRGS